MMCQVADKTVALLADDHHGNALIEYHNSYTKLHDMVSSTLLSLQKFGILHYFRHIETGNSEGPSKEKGIVNILKKFGLDSDEAVYVGDAFSDITAARKSNVPMVAVTWAPTTDKQALEELKPDQLIETVSDFFTYLKK